MASEKKGTRSASATLPGLCFKGEEDERATRVERESVLTLVLQLEQIRPISKLELVLVL